MLCEAIVHPLARVEPRSHILPQNTRYEVISSPGANQGRPQKSLSPALFVGISVTTTANVTTDGRRRSVVDGVEDGVAALHVHEAGDLAEHELPVDPA